MTTRRHLQFIRKMPNLECSHPLWALTLLRRSYVLQLYPWLWTLIALLSSHLFLFLCILDRPKGRPYIISHRDVLREYCGAITHSSLDQTPRCVARPGSGVMLGRLREECEHDSRACNTLDDDKWSSGSRLDVWCSMLGTSYEAASTGTLRVPVLPAIM